MHIESTASALLELASEQQRPLHETLAAAWLASFVSERTRAAYSNNIRIWFGWCEENDTEPLRVARAHVDLWARQQEAQGFAERTVALRLTTLASFYCLLALNGLRISEACGIDVTDRSTRDFHTIIDVRRKGGYRQQIPLAIVTAAAVDAVVDGRMSGPLLLNSAGNRMTQRNAQLIIDRCVPAVRGEHGRITPHALRHSWCTIALQSGANADQVMYDGGWTDVRMATYYCHGQDDPARSVTHAVAGVVLSS